MPTAVYTLSFTRSKLALVCAPGFEILDIETLRSGSVSHVCSGPSAPGDGSRGQIHWSS